MAAYEERLVCITLPAAADLSTKQYCGVIIDANGRAAIATEGSKAIGILQNDPAAIDRAATIATGGVSKVLAGGVITRGQPFSFDGTGRAVTVGSGDDWSMGTMLETTVAGGIYPALLQQTGPTI